MRVMRIINDLIKILTIDCCESIIEIIMTPNYIIALIIFKLSYIL